MPPKSHRLPSVTGRTTTSNQFTVDDRLENIRRLLEVFKGISDAASTPQLSAVFGILVVVLQNVQVKSTYYVFRTSAFV
jgi:hypothetical protein